MPPSVYSLIAITIYGLLFALVMRKIILKQVAERDKDK